MARRLLPALAAVALLAAVAGGLVRAGAPLPALAGAGWLAEAVLAHAALMVCGFMATVIGIERAVAVKLHWAWLAPLASGAGAVCLLRGQDGAGAWSGVVAAVVFCAVNGVVVLRQKAAHSWLLLAGALAWLLGNLLFAAGQASHAVLPWWFAFLALTVAAERLELTRLMRHRPSALPCLGAVVAALLAGGAWSAPEPQAGGVLYGAALLALAGWFLAYDISRRTLLAHGLPRYMAVCLVGGYLWLAIAGMAWSATALGLPLRDAALHALGLGFVMGMMLAHAPVILPAVTGIRLRYGNHFYVAPVALHLSLAVRLGPGLADPGLRAMGATLNAVAMGVFAATVIGAAVAWHATRGSTDAQRR